MKNHNILKEYIELILKEEGENDLYNTFIQPFVDVAHTTGYGIEKLSQQVQTVLKGLFFGFWPLLIPFLSYDFSTFRNQEKDKLDNLQKKYEKTLQANLEAIFSNDAFGLAFLLNPIAMLATKLAIKAPDTAWRSLGMLAGNSWSSSYNGNRSLRNMGFHDPGHHERGAWSSSSGGGGYGTGYGDMGGPGNTFELEEEVNQETHHTPQDVVGLLKNKDFMNKLRISPLVKQMKQDGINLVVNHVKEFLSAKDYNELKQHTQGSPGFASIEQKIAEFNQTGQIPAQDNPTVMNVLVPEIKKVYKEFWIKKLQELTQQYPGAQQEIMNGIKTIQSL